MDPAFHRCGQLYGAGFHFLDLKIYYMVLGFQKKLKDLSKERSVNQKKSQSMVEGLLVIQKRKKEVKRITQKKKK
jgi:hypothetical protein